MSDRLIVRCTVYDGQSVVDVVEQAMLPSELPAALRRVHFSWRSAEALKTGKRIVFEARKETRR